jgi:hypothetical protein
VRELKSGKVLSVFGFLSADMRQNGHFMEKKRLNEKNSGRALGPSNQPPILDFLPLQCKDASFLDGPRRPSFTIKCPGYFLSHKLPSEDD